MRILRLLAFGWLFQMKMLMRSSFNSWLGVLYPLFFATVAFFMFRSGAGGHTLLYASLGAAVMGIWSNTATPAGAAMARERWTGTLELQVAAPVHFALVLLPLTVAMSTIGLYSMAATLLWGWLAFGIHLQITDPLAFVLAIPATIVSIGALGFAMAVLFVRFRQAWALGNMLEYPVWLVAGFLVPLTLFPHWVRWISWLLAPTWGINAIRGAAITGPSYGDIGMALGLGLAYVAVGVLLVHRALDAARNRGTLSLT
jgi:ABC-2 type transport system permease protein